MRSRPVSLPRSPLSTRQRTGRATSGSPISLVRCRRPSSEGHIGPAIYVQCRYSYHFEIVIQPALPRQVGPNRLAFLTAEEKPSGPSVSGRSRAPELATGPRLARSNGLAGAYRPLATPRAAAVGPRVPERSRKMNNVYNSSLFFLKTHTHTHTHTLH